ncbi:hypothetical protein ACJMK2_036328 [Sinanodonta woodiana]|uniref:Uncharacterized protein n=1 Tax=Sinanodonta woodiana TaxID=1069815 RepID=A0ABD3WI67_SINWO
MSSKLLVACHTLIVLSLILKMYSAQNCQLTDCIVSQWENWGECSQTCGYTGTRTRLRSKSLEESCGGSCPYNTSETEACNLRCCPKDCVFTPWSEWMMCSCSNYTCQEPGDRYVCHRLRTKLEEAECGGYCDNRIFEDGCGKLCCYADCVQGTWTFWGACVGQCEQIGVMNRTRRALQEPRCGGKQCKESYEEMECMGGCCPVDCKIGEWSEWSACNTTCGTANQTRSRFVLLPYCNGAACPEEPIDKDNRTCSDYNNVDCLVSTWSTWTDCILFNEVCGDGQKNRTRNTVTPAECNGTPCPDLTETVMCSGPCCPADCVITEWNQWTACSTECGKGISTRSRKVSAPPVCGGTECSSNLLESRDCEVDDALTCQFTEWTDWSECNTNCGFGKSFRTRTLLTPAYCGGLCPNMSTEEQKECESYAARKDCEMSLWGPWGQCVRNCQWGTQSRNRSILVNVECGGMVCPRERVEIHACHEKCEQLCNQGVCSCKTGYKLRPDGYSCYHVVCPEPRIEYCPPQFKYLIDCRYPYFHCNEGNIYNANCSAYCAEDKIGLNMLKGSPTNVTCTESGDWTQPKIYCGRKNKPPVDIKLDKTVLEENIASGTCFAYFTTVTDDEPYERHVYSILRDPTGRFSINENRLCLTRKTNYEEEPSMWQATFRTMDIEGASLSKTFSFEVKNSNDPPTSVTLEPNSIPENSHSGVNVGCLTATDDDFNQTIRMTLVDKDHMNFKMYNSADGRLCITTAKESDARCFPEGGKWCVYNREKQRFRYITIMAEDDGVPSQKSYFDVAIELMDVNDKPASVFLKNGTILENVAPGKTIGALETIDEDKGQKYSYSIQVDKSGLFSVVNGQLSASRVFDYETENQIIFQLTMTSTDNGDPPLSVTQEIQFSVRNVNEKPRNLQLTSANGILPFEVNKPKVKENVKDAVIGIVSAEDEDLGDFLHFSLSKGSDSRLSLVNEKCSKVPGINTYCSVQLILIGSFDFEKQNETYFTIEVKDKESLNASLELKMEIIDTNDKPGNVLINNKDVSILKIPENMNNFFIGNLTADDEDLTNQFQAFSLLDSAEGKFVIKDSQLKTASTANLDFETNRSFPIVIEVKDSGEPPMSYQKILTLELTDVNESPTNTSLSDNTVPENSSPDTVVGRLISEDPDNVVSMVQRFNYSIINDVKGRFKIENDTLKVARSTQMCGSRQCTLDYETEKEIWIRILTTDNGQPSLSREDEFVITINNMNDPPRDIRLSSTSVRENEPVGTVIGYLSAEDDEDGQTLLFNLINGSDKFAIVKGATLATKIVFDYETGSKYNVTAQVADDGYPPEKSEVILQINVLDINEKPKLKMDAEILVPEDSKVGMAVGTVEAIDEDNESQLIVSLSGVSSPFRLSQTFCTSQTRGGTKCNADIILNDTLDFNRVKNYTVQISVIDSKGLGDQKELSVMVLDANNKPKDILLNGLALSVLEIKENSRDLLLASLTVVDPDVNQTHMFAVMDEGQSIFQIIDDKLMVSATAYINYETTRKFNIILTVTDDGVPSLSLNKSLTVVIQDVNESPESIRLINNQVPENSGEDTVVGIFEILDPDNEVTKTQTFNISLKDSAGEIFKIVDNTLKVAASNSQCLLQGGKMCVLNYEEQHKYVLQVVVTDNGMPTASAEFPVEVYVIDRNDPPRNLQLDGRVVKVRDPAGTQIGVLSVDDEDAGQPHLYELLFDTSGSFALSETGNLTTRTQINLKAGSLCTIIVKVTDSYRGEHSSVQKRFTISVIGEVTPTFLLTSNGSNIIYEDNNAIVKENSPVNSTVGTLTVAYDVPNIEMEFSLNHENINTTFGIDSSGVCSTMSQTTTCSVTIKTASAIDFEANQSFDITVQIKTNDSKEFTYYFTVAVQDENEPPLDVLYSADRISVIENKRSQVLESFFAVDPDSEEILNFTLKDNASGRFHISNNGVLYTSEETTFNYESDEKFAITVTVADKGMLEFQKTFTVDIVDINEAPGEATLAPNEVLEMSREGTIIGYVSVEDPDNMRTEIQTLTYVLLDDAGGRFELTGNVLKVSAVGADCVDKGASYCLLDYESQPNHHIVIKAVDDGKPALSSTSTIIITVKDINEQPTDLALSTLLIPENYPPGKAFSVITARDDDPGQEIVFSLLTGQEQFNIQGHNLNLAQNLDYEEVPSYTLSILASDNGTPSMNMTQVFTISVLNVNEAPCSISLLPNNKSSSSFLANQLTVSENLPVATLVGELVALDYDSSDNISFASQSRAISIHNQQCFPVTKGTRCTAEARTGEVYDFESVSELQIQITVTDREGLSLSNVFHVTVKDSNDYPTGILLNGTAVERLSVLENSGSGVLARISAVDPDKGQTHIFSCADKGGYFYVANNELRISSNVTLDYEAEKVHDITIWVIDNGEPSLSFEKNISIDILDVNEKPTEITISNNQVSENAKLNFLIGTLTSTDPDNLKADVQTFTYKLLDDAEKRFKLEGYTIMVSKPNFNFEIKNVYSIIVQVTDSGHPPQSYARSLDIVITNVNDPPYSLTYTGSPAPESLPIGSLVGKLQAYDDDKGQSLAYFLETNSCFGVDGNDVVVIASLDFEREASITFEARVTDNGDPPLSTSRNITITIEDVNEEPVFLEMKPTRNTSGISEDDKINDIIGVITTLDQDRSELIQIRIGNYSDSVFKLDPTGPVCKQNDVLATLCTIDVLLTNVVDYETMPEPRKLIVEVEDKGGLILSSSWSFSIINANEPPRDIMLDSDINSIPENEASLVIGALSTVDDDTDDIHTYQVLSNWDIFTMNNGTLMTRAALDFEKHDRYSVTIRSQDNGEPPMAYTKTFEFSVTDVNEVPSDIKLSHNQIDNSAVINATVGLVSVEDPDNARIRGTGQKHTCKLTPDDFFLIDQYAMAVKVKETIPLDSLGFNITIECTDNGKPPLSLSKDFYINVVEKIDVPKGLLLDSENDLQEIHVYENQYPVDLGEIKVINLFSKASISGAFIFMLQGILPTPFSIQDDRLVVSKSLDFESHAVWILTIHATGVDSNEKSINVTQNITVKVDDVNEAPNGVGIYGGGFVAENSPEGTVIGDLFTDDSENYQTYQYTLWNAAYGQSLKTGTEDLIFAFDLDGRSLKVGPNFRMINYEVSNTITLQVQTTDSGTPPLSTNGTIHIRVLDVNDPASDILLNNVMVEENSGEGTIVGILSIVDEDVNQNYTCELLNINDVPFKIVNSTTIVVAAQTLDFEKQRLYTLQVNCRDNFDKAVPLHLSRTFTVNVTNVNEAPYNMSLSNLIIEENNMVGHVVGEIKVTDPERGKVALSLKGNASSIFSIKGDSTLVAQTEFDFEKEQSYYITIEAVDSDGASTTENFLIKIADVNEVPLNITLDITSIAENSAPGTVIGTLNTVDSDRGQMFIYSLLNSNVTNGYVDINGCKLIVGEKSLDYETLDKLHVFVNSADNGIPSKTVEVGFLIEIIDENEPPEDIIISSIKTVPENTGVQTSIATIEVDDPDKGQNHSCLIRPDDSVFGVAMDEYNQMNLIVLGELDYERQNTVIIEIYCTDGEFNITKSLSIEVDNVNERPESIQISGSDAIIADANIGSIIGNLSVVDPDENQTHLYTVTGPNSDIVKMQNGTYLVLNKNIPTYLLNKPDPRLEFTVTVADNGNPILTYEQNFTLPIILAKIVDQQLPQILISNKELFVDKPVGTIIGELYHINLTLKQDIVFLITKDERCLFEIKNRTLLVLANSAKDVEVTSVHVSITVKNVETFETNTKEITIYLKKDNLCVKDGKICDGNATCMMLNSTHSLCACNADYEGDGFKCKKIDNCKSSSPLEVGPNEEMCLNGGVCIDDINSFVCHCSKGFSGERCEINESEANPCNPNPCDNHAACIPNVDSETGNNSNDLQTFKCLCGPGWTGQRCSASVDDCVRELCYNGGTCMDSNLTYVCTCSPEYKGIRCQYFAETCLNANCNDTHICVAKANVREDFCLLRDQYVLDLKLQNIAHADKLSMQGRLLDFVENNGRLVDKLSGISQANISGRARREVGVFPEKNKNGSVEVFVFDIAELENAYEVQFVVLDEKQEPFSKAEILQLLETTCQDISTYMFKATMDLLTKNLIWNITGILDYYWRSPPDTEKEQIELYSQS